MLIKSLAQGENILMLRIEPSTFVSKVDILTTTPIVHNTVPLDWKVKDKEGEKIVKYRDLRIEIQKLWNTKADVTPIRMGSLGAI